MDSKYDNVKTTVLKIFHCDVSWRVKNQYESRIFFWCFCCLGGQVKFGLEWILVDRVFSRAHPLNGHITMQFPTLDTSFAHEGKVGKTTLVQMIRLHELGKKPRNQDIS